MSERSPEGRAFFEATRELDEPTELDRQRIRAKTLAAIGAAGAASAIPAKAAAAAGQAVAPSGWLGGAVIGALLAIAVVGIETAVEMATDRAPSGRAATSAASSPGSPAASAGSAEPADSPRALPLPAPGGRLVAPAASSENEPPVRGPGTSRLPPSAPTVVAPETSAAQGPPAAPTAHALDEELAVLHQAQDALRAGKPDDAVRALDRYGSSHAGGALEEERLAARIIAACAGHGPEARAEAARFLRERPASPLRERVGSACSDKKTP